jgi:hypothetical protein
MPISFLYRIAPGANPLAAVIVIGGNRFADAAGKTFAIAVADSTARLWSS